MTSGYGYSTGEQKLEERTRTSRLKRSASNDSHMSYNREESVEKKRMTQRSPWLFRSSAIDIEDTTTDNLHHVSDETEPHINTSVQSAESCTDAKQIDESNCCQDNGRTSKCDCFHKISRNIDSIDELDGLCEENESDCTNAISFLQGVSPDIRTAVAKYLSTGNPDHLSISFENLHQVFHLAKMLNLQQLYTHCLGFCSKNSFTEVISPFEGCECKHDIVQESKSGYQRCVSVVQDRDRNLPPEFYIVFSRNAMDTKKSGKARMSVKVIDMSDKMNVFQREIKNTRQLGKGFDCCSCDIKDSPYIFFCGGEGKGSDSMWNYDILLSRWSKCAKMLHGRSRHRLLTDGRGSMFAIGGMEVPCIEEYDIHANKWTEKTSLLHQVHAAVCVLFGDRIYIFGGKTIAGPISAAQYYDISTGKVSRLPDLPCPIYDGEAVVFKNNIFIATRQGHMVCFEPETGMSQLRAHQPVQKIHFGMFLKNERIYVVGGVTRSDSDDSGQTPMYRYNPIKDTWTAENKDYNSFPVYSSCVIKYPTKCCIVPFDDSMY